MLSDNHVHTAFSSDSDTPASEQLKKAMALGIPGITITDHQDFDFPAHKYHMDFTFPTGDYFSELSALRQAYSSQLPVYIGVELGLRAHLKDMLQAYTESYPFDYIIGSIHLVGDIDPFYPELYEGRTERQAYEAYFEEVLQNVSIHNCFDALGHLDYIVRYGPNQNRDYSYRAFQDQLDAILNILVQKGIGLEVNTAGFRYGLGHTNPHPDVLKRYRELGGEIITIGSDAHKSADLGYWFSGLKDYLETCGIKYYAQFINRKPQFIRL